ncbi:TaqI-like C-terminal specificity domain-containing protein, partial [Capnocytophaga gingivalis]
EQRIKAKIEAIGTPLKEWDISINYGIKTGFNDAFIINGEKRAELISQDPKSAEIIRPILRGRDIKRYGYEFADLYIITTFPSLKIDIELYPAVKQHLLSFGYDRLKQTGEKGARKKTNNKWFETQDSIGYWEDFFKEKLLYSEIVKEPQFFLDKNGQFFAEATIFIMTGENLEYLYHLLHSKAITYFFKTFYAGGGLGGDGYRYKKVFLEKLPIPKPILPISLEENTIENSIYKLYGFSEEEIKFIKDQK